MVGTTISHYRITGTLGTGGMGIVYEAQDERLRRLVALKFLPDELASNVDATRRLQREAQTIALLNHPHICIVYEVDTCDGRTFIVMERLEGSNLQTFMAGRHLETTEIVAIAIQVGDALEAAHRMGIVHRDVKPGNVFVNGAGQIKVLDFGLARRFDSVEQASTDTDSSLTGRPRGTLNYMAPERILQMQVDPRSDLFSLGVVIFEMASGKLPFAGTSPAETVSNILEGHPISLTQVSPSRPARLQRIVERLLARLPDMRYQTVAELRKDLLPLHRQTGPLGRIAKWLSE